MFISKLGFEQQKIVFVLFLRNSYADRAENFSTSTRRKSRCVFFFVLKSRFCQIWQVLQNLDDQKTLVFEKVFSILLLLTCQNDNFQKEKKTHPDWVLVSTEKVSARTDELPKSAGAKTFCHFGPCDSQNSVKEASENLGSMTNFALLIEIYLPWDFHKFLPRRFWETPERGFLEGMNPFEIFPSSSRSIRDQKMESKRLEDLMTFPRMIKNLTMVRCFLW